LKSTPQVIRLKGIWKINLLKSRPS
jgi:hypothetical protein